MPSSHPSGWYACKARSANSSSTSDHINTQQTQGLAPSWPGTKNEAARLQTRRTQRAEQGGQDSQQAKKSGLQPVDVTGAVWGCLARQLGRRQARPVVCISHGDCNDVVSLARLVRMPGGGMTAAWLLSIRLHCLRQHCSPTRKLSALLSCVRLRLCLHDSRVELNPGWNQPGLRFLVCLQEAGWNQARRIQQAVFLPPVQFFEKGSCKVHDESFQPGLNCLHAFFSFFQPGLKSQPGLYSRVEIQLGLRFQPGLSYKRAIVFMCVPGWNSSCKHSLRLEHGRALES